MNRAVIAVGGIVDIDAHAVTCDRSHIYDSLISYDVAVGRGIGLRDRVGPGAV